MTNPVLRLGRESATATQQSHRPHSLSLSLIARLPPAPGVLCNSECRCGRRGGIWDRAERGPAVVRGSEGSVEVRKGAVCGVSRGAPHNEDLNFCISQLSRTLSDLVDRIHVRRPIQGQKPGVHKNRCVAAITM